MLVTELRKAAQQINPTEPIKTAAFSKQHFVAIAKIIKDLPLNQAQKREVADKFVDMFKVDNQRFNEDLFFRACGC